MSIARLIGGMFLWIMSGFMFYFFLGFGAMVLNEYFPTVEANPSAALLIYFIFALPALVFFVIGLWIMDEPQAQGGYQG